MKKQELTILKNDFENFYSKHSDKQTREHFNISEFLLKRLLKEFNIERHSYSQNTIFNYNRVENNIDIDELKEYYKEHSDKSTQLKFNIGKVSLLKILKNNSITPHSSKENINLTFIEKYNTIYYTQTQEFKEKVKQTKLERYGDENYNNLDKMKNTCLEKYGVNNYSTTSECKEKVRQTFNEHYGVDNYFQTNESKNKNKQLIENKREQQYTPFQREILFNDDKFIKFINENKNLKAHELADILQVEYWVIISKLYKLDPSHKIILVQSGASNKEKEIQKFLDELNIHYEVNVRNILSDGKELDIYCKDYNIAIEFNGTYWHSTLRNKDKKYHRNKSLECEKLGIRLIHIYEYEWDNYKEKIKSLLRIAFGKTPSRIYARQCVIKELSNKEARIFNDMNHLQNHRNAQITYGLFYNDTLVQLMSFSKHKTYEWEIIRGCPGSNNIVIGGVSKLFKHFLKNNSPKEIFSYCDFNKFDGISYEKLGMNFIGYTCPDLKYVINDKVVNRSPSKYKEHKDKAIAKIYGAGSKKYLWRRDN